MTDALVAFLKARLDEDEQVAQAATQGEWVWSREFVTPPGYHHRTIGPLEPGDSAHIVRHDPARTLREVEAKRLLLEQAITSRHLFTGDQYMDCPLLTEADGAKADHVERIQALNDMYLEELGREPACIDTCGRDARVRRTLELLALPYSDHPGYEEALRQ
ncbi:DUF6221 family protein [Streptomyces sp. NPDC059171]|uniref:DUF6221 family protein n=1 Tax=Streptomyces sp. NPDC059171 TaxID=3346755 RepID=UPI0036A4F99F